MTTSPFRPSENIFRFDNGNQDYSKDFNLMNEIYLDIIRLYGQDAYFIKVEHFNTDEFFGESRLKVLDRAFSVLLWNPNLDADNVTPAFAKSGFAFLNEGDITYYCPVSYFYNNIIDERYFTNTDADSFIKDNVLYIYETDVTATSLYSYIEEGDSVTLAGCTSGDNNATFIVDSVIYNTIELFTGEDKTERTFIWRSEITLIPNTEMIDEVETEIPIIDELFPVNATVHIQKIVTVQPRIGDILWIPKLEQLYQIEYVNDTPPHLMFNRNLSYTFNVKLYSYNTNIKVNDQVIEQAPELADLEDLNDLVLDISNEMLNTEITDILNTTETEQRDTQFRPQSKFSR